MKGEKRTSNIQHQNVQHRMGTTKHADAADLTAELTANERQLGIVIGIGIAEATTESLNADRVKSR